MHDDEETAKEGEEDTDEVDDRERVASNVLVVATVEHVRLANRVLQQHDTEIAFYNSTIQRSHFTTAQHRDRILQQHDTEIAFHNNTAQRSHSTTAQHRDRILQ